MEDLLIKISCEVAQGKQPVPGAFAAAKLYTAIERKGVKSKIYNIGNSEQCEFLDSVCTQGCYTGLIFGTIPFGKIGEKFKGDKHYQAYRREFVSSKLGKTSIPAIKFDEMAKIAEALFDTAVMDGIKISEAKVDSLLDEEIDLTKEEEDGPSSAEIMADFQAVFKKHKLGGLVSFAGRSFGRSFLHLPDWTIAKSEQHGKTKQAITITLKDKTDRNIFESAQWFAEVEKTSISNLESFRLVAGQVKKASGPVGDKIWEEVNADE